MALSINDIVERIKYKEVEFLGKKLEKDQIAQFVKELQGWIMQIKEKL